MNAAVPVDLVTRWVLPRAARGRARSGSEELIRAGDLVGRAQYRLELLLEAGPPGARESQAGRRGLAVLVAEVRNLAEAGAWGGERDQATELVTLLESPSKLVGLGRKLRAGLAGLEQRLWDRVTALLPELLTECEWDHRVA